MSKSEGLRPQILNVTLSATDIEEGIALPLGTKSFRIESDADVRFAFAAGKAEGSNAPYATLKANVGYQSPEKAGWSG